MENSKMTPEEIAKNEKIAIDHNVHVGAATNLFIDEEDRQNILEGKEQDPEWD
jgi:hypothetical protein